MLGRIGKELSIKSNLRSFCELSSAINQYPQYNMRAYVRLGDRFTKTTHRFHYLLQQQFQIELKLLNYTHC